MKLRPLGNWLWFARLQAERQVGSLVLPDCVEVEAYDGLVRDTGEGRLLDGGLPYPLQAFPGDRVVFQRCDAHWLDREQQDGLVLDDRICALLPGPYHDQLLPAGEYCLVEPHKAPALRESKGGILVASHSLAGQDTQWRRRGNELYHELVALGRSERYRGEPTEYDRHRVVWDRLDGLSGDERRALAGAIQDKGEREWKAYVPLLLKEQPKSGTLLAVGPGRVGADGARYPDPVLADLPQGTKVWFRKEYRAVDVWAGNLHRLAIPGRFLEAAEEA